MEAHSWRCGLRSEKPAIGRAESFSRSPQESIRGRPAAGQMPTRDITCLVIVLSATVDALQLGCPLAPSSALSLAKVQRASQIMLSDADETDKKTDAEGEALAKAFAQRLEEEGGATQFKIKTTLTGAADTVKDGVSGAASSVKDVASNVNPGAINTASPTTLLGGLFVAVLYGGRRSNARATATFALALTNFDLTLFAPWCGKDLHGCECGDEQRPIRPIHERRDHARVWTTIAES